MKQKNNLLYGLVLLLSCFLLPITGNAQDVASQRGDLILVQSENVIPEHRDAYIQWAKEFKVVADKANFRSFWVDSDPKGFYYIFVIGKSMADYDAFEKEWEAYRKANPAVDALLMKYKHTFSGSKSELWRHSPSQSYTPAGYKDQNDAGYSRFYSAVIKPGSEEEAVKVLMEYKKAWGENTIKTPYNIYWSVLGGVNGTIVVVDNYKDRQAWLESRAEVFSKVGEAKLTELDKRWRALIVSENEWESTPRLDLGHLKKTQM
jgi:hypothetical protein